MRFLANLLIAVAWMAFTGRFGPLDFLVGLALGAAAILIVDDRPIAYGRRLARAIGFLLAYLWDVARSTAMVGLDVLSPRRAARPVILQVHIDEGLSPPGILLLVCLVAMTPGTMPIDYTPSSRAMRIHAYFGDDPDQVRREVQRYARQIQEVWYS